MDIKDLYRQVIMDHYKNPQNKGLVEDNEYKLVHLNNPSCGDEITIQVKITDGSIKDIRHQGSGCSICCSSASVASITLKDKKIEEGLNILHQYYEMIMGHDFNKDILKGDALAYQGVTQFPARIKCATLAWKAIEKSILEYK